MQTDNYQQFLQRLNSQQFAERNSVAIMLEQDHSPVGDWLQCALKSGYPRVRWEVVKILANSQRQDILPLLCHALSDEVSSISWLAANALLKFGRRGALVLLNTLMSESTKKIPSNLVKFIFGKILPEFSTEIGHLVKVLDTGSSEHIQSAAQYLRQLVICQ